MFLTPSPFRSLALGQPSGSKAHHIHMFKSGCWDRDIAPEGATLEESNASLERVVEEAAQLQRKTGKKVLWGTAQLFKHPRYMHGAATSTLTLCIPGVLTTPIYALELPFLDRVQLPFEWHSVAYC